MRQAEGKIQREKPSGIGVRGNKAAGFVGCCLGWCFVGTTKALAFLGPSSGTLVVDCTFVTSIPPNYASLGARLLSQSLSMPDWRIICLTPNIWMPWTSGGEARQTGGGQRQDSERPPLGATEPGAEKDDDGNGAQREDLSPISNLLIIIST